MAAHCHQDLLLALFLLRLHREMAVDYLQGRITTAKESGPHNCPEKEKYIYTYKYSKV
jgi:hypothetical protein